MFVHQHRLLRRHRLRVEAPGFGKGAVDQVLGDPMAGDDEKADAFQRFPQLTRHQRPPGLTAIS